jgi:hypothetical protein
MPVVQLEDRTLIAVEGEEAETFLQNIITTDLATLGDDEARPSALLSPQGKILFDFLVSRPGENRFRLECRSELADDFVRRLMLYKLRAKATISKDSQSLVVVSWQADSGSSAFDSGVRDSRFAPALNVRRHYAWQPTGTQPRLEWDRLRVENGVAESGSDYAAGDAFPHDVLLDENGGVGFKKGCYIGQEVVSRMQHRGTARRRVLVVSAVASTSGAELFANGRAVGTLGTVAGDKALAIARIDRIKEALDAGHLLTTGGAPAEVQIPPGANFRFSANAQAEGT